MNIRVVLGIAFFIVSCKEKKQKDMKIFDNIKEFIEIQDSIEIRFSKAKMIFDKYHNENEYKELNIVFYYF